MCGIGLKTKPGRKTFTLNLGNHFVLDLMFDPCSKVVKSLNPIKFSN